MRRHKTIMAALLLYSSAWAVPEENTCTSWRELRGKNLHMGLSEEQAKRTMEACRKRKLSIDETQTLLAPVYAARSENLPADCVLMKIEEGLAKQIPWKNVHLAAEQRLAYLRQADKLIAPVQQLRSGDHSHLIMHTSMALESGLPATVLTAVFTRPDGYRYGRLLHVVEAGETLALEGLSAQNIQRVMMACLARDLNRMEIFRAVDYIIAEHHAGKSFDTIHSNLWVAE